MHEKEEEKEGAEKKGLPSDAETRRGEWIGRVGAVCWFSSPDFTAPDKSWSVMEERMAAESTGDAGKTI